MTATPYLAGTLPDEAEYLVAGGGESVVVWSLRTHMRVATFSPPGPVTLGRLTAGRSQGELIVVVADGMARGAVAYRGESGELLWSRRDLPRVLHAAVVEDGAVALSFLRTPAVSLDLRTGETVAAGLRWQSLDSPIVGGVAIATFDGSAAIVEPWTRKRRRRIKGVTLGITATAVAGKRILIASAGWDVPDRRVNAFLREIGPDGAARWEQPLEPRVSILALGFDDRDGTWVGVLHDVEQRSPDVLERRDGSGDVVAQHAAPWSSMDAKTMCGGQLVALTNAGRAPIRLVDTHAGELTASLALCR